MGSVNPAQPGAQGLCAQTPPCSPLLGDFTAVVRDLKRWPGHLCLQMAYGSTLRWWRDAGIGAGAGGALLRLSDADPSYVLAEAVWVPRVAAPSGTTVSLGELAQQWWATLQGQSVQRKRGRRLGGKALENLDPGDYVKRYAQLRRDRLRNGLPAPNIFDMSDDLGVSRSTDHRYRTKHGIPWPPRDGIIDT